LYFYLKNRARLDFLPLFLFILALLSKPSAAVLPLIIFAINHFHYQFKLKNNIKKVLPFALIALIIAIITYFSQANSVIFSQHLSPVWQRPFAWLDSIIFYLAKIIYPNLSISYTLAPKFIATKFWFYPLAILPLGLGFWLWLKRKTQPLLALSSVLFVAGFFTTSGFIGFIFQRYSLVADRYLYFAMLGFALFIAVIFSKISNKIWQLVMIFALLIFAGISAFRQIPIWQNPLKLWSHAVHYEIQPQYAYANLGGYFNEKGTKFYQNGKFQKSIIYFDKALKLYPKYSLEKLSGTKYNKGLSLLALKNPQKALDNFTQALGFNPKNANANNIKIHILTKSKQCQKAQAALVLAKNNNVEIRPEVLKNIKQCVKK
ncbi:MAG: hypothetical protein HAW58_04875, partial [Candidatus Thioglobus sp.]|nr:hypothetical protein [Candidatus Thioglobus sp.]